MRFAYGDRGKPELAQRTEVPVRFSVSHSGAIALLALASRAVGVDVEEVAPVVDHLELARAYFSAEESRALAGESAAQGLRTFFRMWTVKEAYLKATGVGIGDDLTRPRVAFEAGTPVIDARSVGGDWTVHELHPQPGYAAAAVVEGRSGIVRVARWPPPAAEALVR